MTRDFRDGGLIVNDDEQHYDGTTAVVRTEHLDTEEIEFLRWRAERWMKCRYLPVAFAHDPLFVLRHGVRMCRHTFRGSSWRTWIGLESERDAFRRYRGIRQQEREYLGEPPAPLAGRRRTESIARDTASAMPAATVTDAPFQVPQR